MEIKFPTNAYRTMASAELGQLLVETVKAVRDQAKAKALVELQGLFPAGLPLADVLNGSPADFEAALKDAMSVLNGPGPGTPDASGDRDASISVGRHSDGRARREGNT